MSRNKYLLTGFIAIIISFILISSATLNAGESANLTKVEPPQVKRVVLYKHGMGYIERQGKVSDDVTLSMFFRNDQMKDLLTSFFALDLGGGKITSVQYETEEPLSKRLQDILINVPEQAALSQFLVQLKGASISAKVSNETIDGRVLGVEPINEIINGQAVKSGYRLVLLTDLGAVRSFDLMAMSEFNLIDGALQRDLRRLLDISLDSKYTNRKKLTLTAEGNGERELRLGYLIEMPVWKCSYRVIFDEKKKESALIQGWALAENTTEEDWEDVSLSFVAGNPLSYAMDMYSPYYVQRPNVPIPGLPDTAVNWKATSSAETMFAPIKKAEAPRSYEKRVGRKARSAYGNVAQTMDFYEEPAEDDEAPMAALMAGSVSEAAKGTKVGELFSYDVKDKISIARGKAAMAPILSKKIKGKRLLYYKAAFTPKATNAFVLRNDTDVTMDAGAVTFFDGNTSIGEGILGHTLPPGSQEVVPYAIDASVDIVPQVTTERLPHFKGKLADGILTLTRIETLKSSWKITNRGKKPVVLWLNQPKNVYYKLSKPEKPLKEVDNHYRFEVELSAGETKDFEVEEKRSLDETVWLNNSDVTTIEFYASEQYLSKKTRAFLAELSDLMHKRASIERQISDWNEQSQRLVQEEKRLRDNIGRTNTRNAKEAELRAKWMDSLSKAEDKLVNIRVNLDDAGIKNRELKEVIAKKIKEFKEE
jgi:hypothetical protein